MTRHSTRHYPRTGVMRTSTPCKDTLAGKTTGEHQMTVVSEENSEGLPLELAAGNKNGKKVSRVDPVKKVSTCSRISKKSIQQKIYKKGKVTFDKATKSYVKSLPRLIEKNGSCNIISRTINGKQSTSLSDIFITSIETRWRFVLPIFGMSVVISWIVFAGIYFGFSSGNGDFENVSEYHTPCIENGIDFFAVLLFSMETQTTIGYGSRYVNDECAGTILFIMIQSIWGALLQALLTGVVIAKVQKPTRRGNTILFSKTVCICQENDGKYLYIRVADIQKSDMIETSVRAVCVVSTLTTDGDFLSHFRHDMEFKLDKKYNRITLLRWPIVLSHRLQPHSPLYNMDEDDLRNSDLELIILLEGVIESTGMTVQARSSYIPNEFEWQHKFRPMLAKINSSGVCEFHLKCFHETEEVSLGIAYAPYKKLRRVEEKQSSPEQGRESGFSESMDTDISSCGSDFSVFDSKYTCISD